MPVDGPNAKSRSDRTRNELFHCANMQVGTKAESERRPLTAQGVIIGIGMIMIDQHFETLCSTKAPVDSDPTGLKRKASEGDAPLAKKSSIGQIGGKAARGTGYAGGTAEDVREGDRYPALCSFSLRSPARSSPPRVRRKRTNR